MDETVEQKVLEKIRSVLTADATIKSFVADRVYTAHVSTIESPEYPAISMTLMPGQARTDVPEMVNMVFQIDLWFPRAQYTVDKTLECYARVRALLHRQHLTDKTIGIQINDIKESGIGPLLYDQGMAGHHLPARYAVVAV